jgi:sugar phosphate isomerase/epimerase
MAVEERIGPSTLISGEAGARAMASTITQVKEAGFKTIELCPAQFHAVDPLTAPSFLEHLFGEAERRRLRTMLSPFRVVTVHSSSYWVTKIRCGKTKEDLWKPYLELMRFARDIGAQIVSFHPLQRSEGATISNNDMFAYNLEFGKKAVECAEDWNLAVAFENMPSNGGWSLLETVTEIIAEVDSDRFNLLFDIGHAVLQRGASSGNLTQPILHMIEKYVDQTLQFHVHGVQRTEGDTDVGLRDHSPLDENNVLDYFQIMRLLKKKRFEGPIILEIYLETASEKRASFQANLKACMGAKKELTKYWM